MISRFANFTRSLISWVFATLVVCACLVGFLAFQRADEELRLRAEQKLDELFPDHHVRVGAAHYVRKSGLRLRRVSIFPPASEEERKELVFCDEVLLSCAPSLDDVLRGELHIERAIVRGLSAQAVRARDGSWNLADLVAIKTAQAGSPIVELENATIKVTDERGQLPALDIRVIEGLIKPETHDPDGRKFTLTGQCAGNLFEAAQLEAHVDPQTGFWDLAGRVTEMQWDSRIWKLLPRSEQPPASSIHALSVDGLSIDGLQLVTDFSFSMAQGSGESIPRFRIVGNRLQGRFDGGAALPHPLTEISAEAFQIERAAEVGWRLHNAQARFGLAELRFSARSDSLQPTGSLHLVGTARDLDLTRELIGLLPKKPQAVWEKYRPLGLVDIKQIELKRHDGRWHVVDSDVECRDVALLCSHFRYPISRAQGRVRFRQDELLSIELWASADNGPRTPIQIRANIDRPGPHFSGTVATRSQSWLPIDEPLRAAVHPHVRRILTDLNAQGELSFVAELRRDSTTDNVLRKNIAIGVREGTIQYKAFPYPLRRVSGNVHVTDDFWTFKDFEGENDSCTVVANGDWLPPGSPYHQDAGRTPDPSPATGQLRLNFLAKDIPCDAELRSALPPGPQKIWRSLRPTGHVDHVEINLLHRSGMSKPEIDILARQEQPEAGILPRGLEMQPTWFPIRMNRVTGTVDYRHGGSFTLSNLRANYGSPRNAVQLRSMGGGEFRDDGTWVVQLDRIVADGFDVTPELISALPQDLGNAMKALHFRGKLFVDGEMRFMGNSQPNSFVESDWSASLNVDSGSWTVAGHDISNAFGDVHVQGYRKPDDRRSYGTADFPTLICRGVQVTQLRTPWHMDQRRLTFGAYASTAADDRTPSMTARLFGGDLHADGFVSLVNNHAFRCYAELVGFDAAQLSGDLGVASKITGDGDARLHLTGSAEGSHTLGGGGSVRLRNADLGKLPGIIRLVNEMKVRNVRPDVFSSSDIVFDVSGPYLNCRRFDLHGESLSLKGKGWIGFDRRINLAFYPIAGGEKGWAPLARPLVNLVGWGGEKLLQTVVSGTIDNLSMSQEVLPGLNELIPEQSRQPALPRTR